MFLDDGIEFVRPIKRRKRKARVAQGEEQRLNSVVSSSDINVDTGDLILPKKKKKKVSTKDVTPETSTKSVCACNVFFFILLKKFDLPF